MKGFVDFDTNGFDSVYRLTIYDGQDLLAEVYASVERFRDGLDDALSRLRLKRVGEWGDEIEIEFVS